MNKIEAYNQAIKSIQEENLEEAKKILTDLYFQYPNDSHTTWALGVVQAQLGFPHISLQLWEDINLEREKEIYKQKLISFLPIYEEIYQVHNNVLKLIQQEKNEEAYHCIKSLILNNEFLPLPLQIYHSYLLLSILVKKKKINLKEISSFPLYVQNSKAVKEFEIKTENYLINKKNKFNTRFAFGIGLIATLIIGISIAIIVNDEKGNIVTSQEPSSLNEEAYVEILKGKINSYEKEIDSLTDEKNNLSDQMTQVLNKVEDSQKYKVILDTIYSTTPLPELEKKAGFKNYSTGLQAYRNNEYSKAINDFNLSLELSGEEYYSDDTLFFLIQSYNSINDLELVQTLSDEFLNHKNVNYVQSPYYDDILLGKAEMLIKSNNPNDATLLLETIVEEYPKEWTAIKSKEIISQLEGKE